MGRARAKNTAMTANATRSQTSTSTFEAEIKFKLFPREGQPEKPSGFTIAKARRMDTGETITLKGGYGPVDQGEVILVLKSYYKKDMQYGDYYDVQRIDHSDPTGAANIERYLTRMNRVSPSMAKAIVAEFGDETLTKLDANPELLKKVKHDAPDSMKKLMEEWGYKRALKRNLIYLSEHGFSNSQATRIATHFRDHIVEDLVKDNPYVLCDVKEVSFSRIDTTSLKNGISPDDPRRLAAGAENIIAEAEFDGHICLDIDETIERAQASLNSSASKEDFEQAILAMVNRGNLYIDDSYQPPKVYTLENFTIETRLISSIEQRLDNKEDIPEGFAPTEGSHLTDEQFTASKNAFENGLSVLTGAAGCGKCVTGDTMVLLNDKLINIEAAWDTSTGEIVFDGEGDWMILDEPMKTASIDEAGKMTIGKVSKLYRQRINEKGDFVRLSSGNQITMTKRHRLLTTDGWQANIQEGDFVSLPSKLPASGNSRNLAMVKLLAWQIAEGYEEASKNDITITQKDKTVLTDLQVIIESLSADLDIFMGTARIKQPQDKAAYLSFGSKEYKEWLSARGYVWGQRSKYKSIPEWIVNADKNTIKTFLGEYISAEGFVNSETGIVEISSASEVLVNQLDIMFRKLGIWMRIKSSMKRATSGKNKSQLYYSGIISGDSIKKLAAEVSVSSSIKQEKINNLLHRESNPNLDLVPVKDLLLKASEVSGLGQTYFFNDASKVCSRGGVSSTRANSFLTKMQEIIDGSKLDSAKQAVSAGGKASGSLSQLLDRIEQADTVKLKSAYEEAQTIINRDTINVKVVESKEVNLDCWVYDLEVEEHHNYVANGIISHNTTALKELLDQADQYGQSTLCLAPTGKAAKRMTEATGREAKTIHRALGIAGMQPPNLETDSYCDESSIIHSDIVIVDESSMLDMRVAERLFSHLSEESKIVFVGDPNQLPPVGAGSVLLDLIESKRAPGTHLNKVFRQGEGSLLVLNANRIKDGLEPYWTKDEAEAAIGGKVKNDWEFIEDSSPASVKKRVVKLATSLPQQMGISQDEIMITAPTRKATTGVHSLNEAMADKFNPTGALIREDDEKGNLRDGDRVMNTKNIYGRKNHPDIMNGDTGHITEVLDDGSVRVDFDSSESILLDPFKASGLIAAYVSTTHKLQGSEAPVIICPIAGSGGERLLSRNLVYTAWTRGKEKCIIIGEKEKIIKAAQTDGAARNTTLDLKLSEAGNSQDRLDILESIKIEKLEKRYDETELDQDD